MLVAKNTKNSLSRHVFLAVFRCCSSVSLRLAYSSLQLQVTNKLVQPIHIGVFFGSFQIGFCQKFNPIPYLTAQLLEDGVGYSRIEAQCPRIMC